MLHYRYLGEEYIESRDRKNREGKNRIPLIKPVEYDRNVPCTCPDNTQINIYEWLAKHKGEAFNVLEA